MSTPPDLETRLRRDLTELAAVPAPLRSRREPTGGRPAAAALLAVAVVIVLLAAGIGIARVAGRNTSSVRPGRGTQSVPRPAPTTSNTLPITATSPTTPAASAGSTPTTIGVALEQVDWNAVDYPIDCGTPAVTPKTTVQKIAYATPHHNRPVAVALVRCNAGAGSPSSSLFVYDGSTSRTTPHLAAALLTASDNWVVNDFTAAGSTLTVPVLGFSSDSVARCCGDVHATLTWQWNGTGYALEGTPPPHLTYP